MTDFNKSIETLQKLDVSKMYGEDFFLTWEKSDDELQGVWAVADALRALRERNISTKVFDSGLGISLFRDNSTRTRFSFASACNLLGLEVQDLDEGKSQIAHGETVRETANMISFMADVIGIRDDMYIGKGNAYMHEVSDAVKEGHEDGVLEQRPTLVNLQCDIDHPTQIMAGIGNYRGETAGAIGIAHYRTEDTMFNVGVSLGTSHNMVNAGVTHKFGGSRERKDAIPERYKAGPISSVYVMQDEVSSLKKENSNQKTVIANQAARLNTLEAENERQRQELAETKQGLDDLRAVVNQLLASKG